MSENRRLTDFATDAATDQAGDGEDDGTGEDAPPGAADDRPSAGGEAAATAAEGTPTDPGAGAGQEGAATAATGEREGDEEPATPAPPEGPTVTFTADPDGGPCAECGASATRRWADGDRLVCPGCKDW